MDKMIKAVIFDLDGTLIDSMGVWLDVDKEFLQRRDIVVPPNLFDEIEGGNSFSETADFFKKRFNLSDSIEEIMQEWTDMVFHHYRDMVKLKSGALELLNYLKKNSISMAVGTSNSDYLAETVLKSNNILSYFKLVITGKDHIKGKPFPDIFLEAAKRMDKLPNECIVIEDTYAGVMAAKNANIKVCGIYDKHSEREISKIKATADWYVTDFYQLYDLIKGLI